MYKSFIKDFINNVTIGLDIKDIVDVEKEKARLTKSKLSVELDLSKILEKLNNQGFMNKASPEVILQFEDNKHEIQEKLNKINSILIKL